MCTAVVQNARRLPDISYNIQHTSGLLVTPATVRNNFRRIDKQEVEVKPRIVQNSAGR